MKVWLFSHNGLDYYAYGHTIHRMRVRRISVEEIKQAIVNPDTVGTGKNSRLADKDGVRVFFKLNGNGNGEVKVQSVVRRLTVGGLTRNLA